MGIMPDPGTFNDHCQRCWPIYETPELLKCFISGITYNVDNFPGLPAAPNGYVDLTQTGIACEWTGHGDIIWRATFGLHVADSRLRVETKLDVFAFSNTVHDICKFYFVNAFIDPAVHAYTGGYGMIATPAEIQSWIELAMPVTGPDPRMELFPMKDRQIVIRFANIQNGTNINLRLNVDDLP